MRDFKKLKIWQTGMKVAEHVYDLVKLLPKVEQYGLRSQLSRAAVSVPTNIAEGGSRKSKKEYKYYLQIALGSCFELETQLLLLSRIGLVEGSSVEGVLDLVYEEQKMISGFLRKLGT